MKTVTIPQPFNSHGHLREKPLLMLAAIQAGLYYCGYVAIGNLEHRPIITLSDRDWYRDELEPFLSDDFILLLPQMLKRNTTVKIIADAHQAGQTLIKCIPDDTSSFSSNGFSLPNLITDCQDQLKFMEANLIPLLLHLELIRNPGTGNLIEPIKREESAIPYFLKLRDIFPDLPIVVEHASTLKLLEVVDDTPDYIMVTLTPQHATVIYDQVFDDLGRIKNPHLYCLPVAKTPDDRDAVRERIVDNRNKYAAGNDSAPHNVIFKTGKEPRAGTYTDPVATPIYLSVFDDAGELRNQCKLNDFFYNNAARFYGLPPARKQVTYAKDYWQVPPRYGDVVPLMADKYLDWQLENT